MFKDIRSKKLHLLGRRQSRPNFHIAQRTKIKMRSYVPMLAADLADTAIAVALHDRTIVAKRAAAAALPAYYTVHHDKSKAHQSANTVAVCYLWQVRLTISVIRLRM